MQLSSCPVLPQSRPSIMMTTSGDSVNRSTASSDQKDPKQPKPRLLTATALSRSLVVLAIGLVCVAYVAINRYEQQPNVSAPDTSRAASSSLLTSVPAASKSFDEYIQSKTTLHEFNRRKLLPRLRSLVSLDYFRFVRVNLNRPCQLWCDAWSKCNRKDCAVQVIDDPEKCPKLANEDELAIVDTKLPDDQLDLLIKLFECNEEDDPDSEYVDLVINPERFTGYSGESANRIWRTIYEENCFIRKTRSPFDPELCYEERLFYEAISGLHSSINIHLCAEYPTVGLVDSNFEPNLEEFLRRFNGHNDYLQNLYTLFLLELRALKVAGPYLAKDFKWADSSAKSGVLGLIKMAETFDIPQFQDISLQPSYVSHELAVHFRNITTTIIDCVACDKCKLWGKVQLRGLGAAFKILSVKDVDQLSLNHQEIVSLINAVARLSHSVRHLETFRDLQESKSARTSNKFYDVR